jgi:hypothetical protein
MKIRVWHSKDKSKASRNDTSRLVATEMKGVPVRVTTYPQATRTSGAEAVLILTRGSIRSVVARAGELNLYLSARAEFRVIEPDPPEPGKTYPPEALLPDPEALTLCAACRDGCHAMCENADTEDDWCECNHASHITGEPQ